MKFLRHLAAVVVVVAVIVGLGMLWAHVSGGGISQPPPHQILLRENQIKAGVVRVQSDDGFNLSDTRNLIQTCVIEAVLAAVVITASVVWRQRRRARRAAAGKA